MREKIKKIFEITTDENTMKRFERFLALLHFNSSFGHSNLFGMSLDGDGWEKMNITGIPEELSNEVDAIGGVGYGVEIANSNGYSGVFVDRKRESRYYTKPSANLYKNGEVIKTIPSRDYDYFEE